MALISVFGWCTVTFLLWDLIRFISAVLKMFRVYLYTELTAASLMLEPFGEVPE